MGKNSEFRTLTCKQCQHLVPESERIERKEKLQNFNKWLNKQ